MIIKEGYNMRKIVIIVISVLTFSGLYAQQNQQQLPNRSNNNNQAGSESSGKLFLSGGAGFLNMDAFNAALSGSNFPALAGEYPTLGFTYQFINGRVCNEADFTWILKRSTIDGIFHSSYWGFYTTYNVGYFLVNSRHFDLFPLIGLGYGKQNVSLVEYSGPSFTDFLVATPDNIRLDSKSFLLNFGLGFDVKIGSTSGEGDTLSFVIGLRAGYLYQASVSVWNANEVELPQSPDNRMSGFYVKLLIGMGESSAY